MTSNSPQPILLNGGTRPALPGRVSGVFPLSFSQESLWLHEQLSSSSAYNMPEAWRLSGPLDKEALRNALNHLVERHETLRTVFRQEEGKPVQVVLTQAEFPLEEILVLPGAQAELEERIREECRKRFNLREGPLARGVLFETSPEQHLLLVNLHHLVCDGWSQAVFIKDLAAIYSRLVEGAETFADDLPVQFADFAVWQRETFSGEASEKQLAHWKEALSESPAPVTLIPDLRLSASTSQDQATTRFYSLDNLLTKALSDFSRENHVTLFTTLLAVFNVLLNRVTGETDIVVGCPVAGRERIETENLVGLFVNTHPVRTRLSPDLTFLEFLEAVQTGALGLIGNQNVPLSAIVEQLNPAQGRRPMFQVAFGLQGEPAENVRMAGLQLECVELDNGAAKFDWTLLLTRTSQGISIRSEHRSALYREKTIERLIGQYELLLREVLKDPAKRLKDYSLLTSRERDLILQNWNGPDRKMDCSSSVPEVFRVVARSHPQKAALVAGDHQLSYAELDRASDGVSRRLQDAGLEVGDKVALCFERSPELIIAMLGILKAGGVYVPLDASYPAERKEAVCKISGARFLLDDGLGSESICALPGLRQVSLSAAEDAGTPESRGLTGDDLAYVMFTSGSTGTPKGVSITHRAILRLVQEPNYVEISEQDVFLHFAPAAFDASTFEVWGALLNGATLAVCPPHMLSLSELAAIIQSHKVTVLWLTAGLFNQMVDHQVESLCGVKQLLTGGEALSVPHVLKALAALPGTTLINGYGPTENTTFSCCYRIPRNWEGGASVPIGTPITNSKGWILDANLNLCPVGAVGELFVSGYGLAREYIGQPALTAERFAMIAPLPGDPPIRMYRTGDLARWLDEGVIEFLGRNDSQVKIRGFRIELGEIEAALMAAPQVRAALVLAVDAPTGRQLVAYVVPVQAAAGASGQDLVLFLAARLPSYMVPVKVICLDQFPLTANGKVDCRALPDPFAVEDLASERMPPASDVEKKIAAVWGEVLGRNTFDVRQDFFQLGGHSLLATQAASRLSQVFNTDVPVVALFQHSTIRDLAQALPISATGGGQSPKITRALPVEDAQGLLGRLDELSESEIEELLEQLDESSNQT